MIILFLGLGFKEYFKHKFNIFDLAIVILSTFDVILSKIHIIKPKGIQVIRSFRLLRIFKIAKRWKTLKIHLKLIRITLKDISNFSILLFIFIFTYTLIGLEWFAYRLKFSKGD
jgi:hypothetical protein